jgi:glucokinase
MKIGIDLGGTNIRVGLVENNIILEKISESSNSDKTKQEVLDHLINMIRKVITLYVKSIGIGVPSVVDVKKGIVYNVANIPSWDEVPLKAILEKEFGVPVAVNNDCNCFVKGEHSSGEAAEYTDVVGLALGTGVGAGIVFNNQLCNGANTGAGEVGELPYLQHNYEYYCSSHFFIKEHNTTGKEVYDRASKGDAEALRLFDEFGIHVGNLIKVVLLAYDPQIIVLGGSISKSFSFFSDKMYETLDSFPYPETVAKLKITCSSNNDVAILGAADLL